MPRDLRTAATAAVAANRFRRRSTYTVQELGAIASRPDARDAPALDPAAIDDLIALPTLDEDAFVDALRARFERDLIYTRAADVLTVRNGTWKFQRGDDAHWSSPAFDDSPNMTSWRVFKALVDDGTYSPDCS